MIRIPTSISSIIINSIREKHERRNRKENDTSRKRDKPNKKEFSVRDPFGALIFEILNTTRTLIVVHLLQQWLL
jgi:hypothetical protein